MRTLLVQVHEELYWYCLVQKSDFITCGKGDPPNSQFEIKIRQQKPLLPHFWDFRYNEHFTSYNCSCWKLSWREVLQLKTSFPGVPSSPSSASSSAMGGGGDEKSKHMPCMTCSYDSERSCEVSWWYATRWLRHWFSRIRFAFSFANLDFSASRVSSWSLTCQKHNSPCLAYQQYLRLQILLFLSLFFFTTQCRLQQQVLKLGSSSENW